MYHLFLFSDVIENVIDMETIDGKCMEENDTELLELGTRYTQLLQLITSDSVLLNVISLVMVNDILYISEISVQNKKIERKGKNICVKKQQKCTTLEVDLDTKYEEDFTQGSKDVDELDAACHSYN